MSERVYYVYILAGKSTVLYIGVTRDLVRRLVEHRAGKGSAFTAKYKVTQLVCYEVFGSPGAAIAREKQIKGWVRAKKLALIEAKNPGWRDLGEDFL
ncbi:MAG: GIY-YIG nuclease family protein [Candidatus Acidiferrales bacterium]